MSYRRRGGDDRRRDSRPWRDDRRRERSRERERPSRNGGRRSRSRSRERDRRRPSLAESSSTSSPSSARTAATTSTTTAAPAPASRPARAGPTTEQLKALPEQERERALLQARIAARAEERAAARRAVMTGKMDEIAKHAVSLEEMLKAKEVQKTQAKAAEQVRFLTKEERVALAAQREKEEEEEERARIEAERKARREMFSSTSDKARREREKLEADRLRLKRERSLEFRAIKETYLGLKKKKKKMVKPSEKFSRIFKFDWDKTDDTSQDLNPIYANRMRPQLAFGRGYVAGMDMRQQRQSNTYMETLLTKRQEQQRTAEREMDLSREQLARKDKQRRRAREKLREDHAEAVKRLNAADPAELRGKHWRDKLGHEMTVRDWRILREDFDIRVRGGRAPNPLRDWYEHDLPDFVLKAVRALGFKEPSPIQRQAIPIGMINRDIIGIAETGSGKTAAFMIPLIMHVMKLPAAMRLRTKEDGPLSVVLAPTRELAQQIEQETIRLAQFTDIKTVSIVGGNSIEEQGFKIREGCDIVIATPGRLLDCLENRYAVLNQCNYIILDEADRMVDMGFETQLNGVLDQMATLLKAEAEEEAEQQEKAMAEGAIAAAAGAGGEGAGAASPPVLYRTTAMFSATMPAGVERLAKKFLRHPAIISIGDRESTRNMRIEQRVVMVKPNEKQRKLEATLRQAAPPVIVFCNLRRLCDTLVRQISNMGMKATALHGGKRQDAREEALRRFKAQEFDILVATDVAGRGLDIPNVQNVINYDMAKDIEKYCHRIGRTGRAGKTGIATTFLCEGESNDGGDEDLFYDLKEYLESTKNAVPAELARHPKAKIKPGGFPAKGGRVQFAVGSNGGSIYNKK